MRHEALLVFLLGPKLFLTLAFFFTSNAPVIHVNSVSPRDAYEDSALYLKNDPKTKSEEVEGNL